MDSDSETGSDKTSISSLGMDSDSETGSDKTSKPLYSKGTLIPRCVSTSCLGMDSDSETGSDKASKPEPELIFTSEERETERMSGVAKKLANVTTFKAGKTIDWDGMAKR
ncbi:unnamed protein product [Ilex paraguariensis]|uniref:Uncharacterized protein n=1 Tax=Ilex paraguariensis TaxID=185542 RepID=A0ABC8TQF3_9AQUA